MVAKAQRLPFPGGSVFVWVSGPVPRGKRYVEVREVLRPQGVAKGKPLVGADPAVESLEAGSG